MQHESLFADYVLNLKTAPSSYQAYGKCPFHEDNRASFSCNLETGLWSCKAGCGVGNAITFARRLGARSPSPETEWMPSHRLTSSAPASSARNFSENRRVVATYEYEYEDGLKAFRVLRYEPKGFAQQRWENGSWVWGTQGIRRVPYRLPQILETTQTIFLVEGEKDVHALENISLVATTIPMGASAWQPDYARYFANKRVAILPDNDPQGKAYANRSAEDIAAVAVAVKLIELPGLMEKEDVSDYLANSNHSRKTLLALIRLSPEFKKFQPSKLNPVEYFAKHNLKIIPGSSLIPGEFQPNCKQAFLEFCEIAEQCTDEIAKKINLLDEAWKSCRTEWQYNRFLRTLKEMHELSVS